MTTSTMTTQHKKIDPSALARKSVEAEAFVTSWRSLSENCQAVTARWPRRHEFYVEGDRYSPLLATETLRQALAMLTHTAHDIPLTHRLGWEHIRTTVSPEALLVGAEPADVELVIRHTDVRRRRLGSAHIVSQVEATQAGVPIGTATLRYSTHPPAVYDRLRGRYADSKDAFARAIPLTAPVASWRVGRGSERNVVLSPADRPHSWQLRVDTSHRVLFDHPHDHVPGMVLLEAACQAAIAEVAPAPVTPVALDTMFERYVEFDRPCFITSKTLARDHRGETEVKVEAHQDQRLVFSAVVTTRPR